MPLKTYMKDLFKKKIFNVVFHAITMIRETFIANSLIHAAGFLNFHLKFWSASFRSLRTSHMNHFYGAFVSCMKFDSSSPHSL